MKTDNDLVCRMDDTMDNQHFERAVQDVNNMEKHFTSAINHLTKAVVEKDEEYKSIKDENARLRERQKHVNEFITVIATISLLLYVLGFTSGWYVCP